MDLVALLIQIVVSTIILAPVLWLAGRALVGKEKAIIKQARMQISSLVCSPLILE
jgi:hypothetical protein